MDRGGFAGFPRTYSCKRCRFVLFTSNNLTDEHQVQIDCSLLYLCSTHILPWMKTAVEEVGWTRGKLYCPQCEARIGAFSFLHFIMCQCNHETMPAIYCVRSKIDEMKPHSLLEVENENDVNLIASTSFEFLGDVYDPNIPVENALTQMIVNDALGMDDNSLDGRETVSIVKEFEKPEMVDSMPVDKKNVIQRRSNSVTTYENTCFDPEVLPIYPEVYPEEEFSSRVEEEVTRDRCDNKKVYYTSHSMTPHLSCCRRCQLLHEQLLQRSENHQRERAGASCTNVFCLRSEHSCSNDSEWSESEESVIYAEMKDVQRRLQDLQGYLKNEAVCNQMGSATCSRGCSSKRRRKRRKERKKATCMMEGSNEKENEKETKEIAQDAEEEVSEQHQCPVCLDILYEPHKTACSHTFCAPCLRQINKVSRKKPVCPLCRHRIYHVQPLEELQEEIESFYPGLYRKRLQIEMQRPINKLPLPSPNNVRFDTPMDRDPRPSINHIFYVFRTCLIIFFMLLTYLINTNDGRALHRRYSKWIKYAIFVIVGAGFSYLLFCIGLWVSSYAVDVSLFGITLCFCYFFIAKILFELYRDAGINVNT